MTDLYLSVSLEAKHDFDTAAVTRRLGVEPTQIRKLGTPMHPGHDALYKYNSWEWDTGHISADDAGELIAQAAAMFQSRATVMRELADEYGGKWAIVLDGYIHSGDAPTVLLPPDFVEFCAAIGAIFQYVIDISYDYSSEGGADRGTAEDRPDTHRG